MHRPSAAKIATLNSASIMSPSIESRLPFEGLICRSSEIFPVTDSASDDHHSLALLFGGPLVGAPKRTGVSVNVRFTPNSGHWNSISKCPLCAKNGHEEGDFLNLGVTRRNGRGAVMGTQVIGVV